MVKRMDISRHMVLLNGVLSLLRSSCIEYCVDFVSYPYCSAQVSAIFTYMIGIILEMAHSVFNEPNNLRWRMAVVCLVVVAVVVSCLGYGLSWFE